jgi:AraC-like DNA-binding protein
MSLIATLLPHPLQLQRVRAAIRGQHDVVACADWPELVAVCETQPIQSVVIDLGATENARFDHIRQLRLQHPRLTLVAYVVLTIERAHDLFEAGRYGFDGLVIAGRDDAPKPFLAELAQAESRGLASMVRRMLGDVSPQARDAVLISVARAHEPLSAQQLATLIGVRGRRLSKVLSDAGLPRPHRLITFGRLLLAAHMLEDPGRRADGVAAALAFPSGGAFRNACQRYVHAAPHQIRERGGAAYVLEVLQSQMRARPQQKTTATTPRGTAPRASTPRSATPASGAAASTVEVVAPALTRVIPLALLAPPAEEPELASSGANS